LATNKQIDPSSKSDLLEQIAVLKRENETLKKQLSIHFEEKISKKVKSPESFKPIFDKAEETVARYFDAISFKPSKGTITINDDRYVLIRASALSYDFFKELKTLYRDEGENEAFDIGQNFLFDIGHVIGIEDAKQFHDKMKLTNPIERLAAGPVHFAYSGWAFVDILPESTPSLDENFFLKYNHPYSFEADSWISKNKKSKKPVCIMNAAYSSGWCEQSFGMELTAVEITCRAKGDENCTFIMAPPHKIENHLKSIKQTKSKKHKVPVFFERKSIEKTIKESLDEKETLLKEIHHRVKNNLQIISSFLNLQFSEIENKEISDAIEKSKDRIHSMALIHTKLYQSNNLSSIHFDDYLKELVSYIKHGYGTNNNVVTNTDITKASFNIDLSISLGLIVTEVLTNAYKHAFPMGRPGLVNISLQLINDDQYKIVIEDNGVGLKIKDPVGKKKTTSLGLEIIQALGDQIDGQLKFEEENGLKFSVIFSK
jgi:two-component sensor histidine kinase/predicted hydrocarbon binding protein